MRRRYLWLIGILGGLAMFPSMMLGKRIIDSLGLSAHNADTAR